MSGPDETRSEQEIRADLDVCFTERGHLSKRGARVLGDVPGLLDSVARLERERDAARAEADRLREAIEAALHELQVSPDGPAHSPRSLTLRAVIRARTVMLRSAVAAGGSR